MNAKKKPDHEIEAERLKDRAEARVREATRNLTHYLEQVGVKTSDPDVRVEIGYIVESTAEAGRDLALAEVAEKFAKLDVRLEETTRRVAHIPLPEGT